jgi:hypothetical protein
VQLGDPFGPLVEQPSAQHLAEQVVIAIPLAAVVERHEKEVRPVERLEDAAAARRARDGIAEVAGEARQDGGLQQEGAHRVVLLLQHLFDEVVDDVPIVAGEPGDEGCRVVPAPQRQRGELDRGDPPLGAFAERPHVVVADPEPHAAVEVLGCLVGGEAQVGRAQLEQPAERAQPGEGQRRVGAGRDHESHVLGKPVDEEGQTGVDRRVLDGVEVVEHQHDLACARVEVVDQRGQRRFGGVRRREQVEGRRAGSRDGPVEGRDDVGPELVLGVVAFIERDPGDGGVAVEGREPFGEDARLAETCGSGDEDEPRTGGESLGEPRAGHARRAARGRVELGRDEGTRHARPFRCAW